MPITQQIGSSSLAKPGVCTFTTRPATPYEGQVIYETDTDKTLVWNGLAWVYMSTSTANPVGLELITSCTVTSSGGTAATASNGVITIGNGNTTLTVTAFSAAYENYRIICTSGSASTNIQIRLAFNNIVANYYGGYSGTNYVTSAFYGQNDNNGSLWSWVGFGSTSALYMDCDISSPFVAGRKFIHAKNTYVFAGNAYGTFIGECANTTSATGFTITPNTGSFSGGTIRVYGYRNSA